MLSLALKPGIVPIVLALSYSEALPFYGALFVGGTKLLSIPFVH